MASVTTTGSGNTDSTTPDAPWPLGVLPGPDDTIILGNTFTLTNPAGVTFECGDSPADDTGTAALACVGTTGTGVFVNNGTFIHKGPVRLARGTHTVGPGSIWEHDSSAAAVPATANYTVQVGQTSGTATILLISGVSGDRAVFRIAAGSGVSGGFTGGTLNRCGQVKATYATISDWGTAAGRCAYASLSTTGDALYFDNCLMDRCGVVAIATCVNGCTFRVKNTSYRSPVNTGGQSFVADGSGAGFSISSASGDRRIENSYIEGQISFFNGSVNTSAFGMHFVNVVFAGTTAVAPMTMPGMPAITEWVNVLLYNRVNATGTPSNVPGGTLTRTILTRIGGSTNPHFVESIKAPVTFDGWIAENNENAGKNGDLFQTITRASAFAVIVKNGIQLPDASNTTFGPIVNHSTGTAANGTTVFTPTITVEHCTWEGSDTGSITGGVGGENNTSFAAHHASIKSNLVWKASAGTGWVVKWHNSTTPVDNAFTACDHNGVPNLTGVIYHRAVSNPGIYTTAPGTGDVTTDPDYIDSSRDFLSWAQSVDATVTTWANALNRFSLMNDDSGSIAGFTISACYDWIWYGFTPQNVADYATSGHDGTWIGAVEPLASSSVDRVAERNRSMLFQQIVTMSGR